MTDIVNEQELRDIYYDPSESYKSAKKLYRQAKEKGLGVSRKMVKKWLKMVRNARYVHEI